MMLSVYYDRNLAQTYVSDPPGSNVDTLAPATQKVLGLEAKPDIESAAGNTTVSGLSSLTSQIWNIFKQAR